MQPPIFLVCANGDLLLFGSVEALTRYVESPDVESGEYVCAYDATGRRCTLELEEPTRRRRVLGIDVIGLSVVTLRPTDESEPDVLAGMIAARLNRNVGELASLVDEACRTWPEH
jgi:hypothetical protein